MSVLSFRSRAFVAAAFSVVLAGGAHASDASLPVFGSMTYSLAGATAAIDRVTGAVGTLSGSLTVDFQNARYNVTPNLNIAMTAGPTYATGAGTTLVGPDGARATSSTMT